MKISVITAVYNRADTIAQAVRSVESQTWQDVEHLVIDGASSDGTLQALQNCLNDKLVWTSEPDNGIYDALNKGMARATGDVIGLMHSDDFYADEHVLTRVASAFADPNVDAVYGDLDYVSKYDSQKIIRRWRSCFYRPDLLSSGWMPPHPTLYFRRSLIERLGSFDTRFLISADYDFILRYFGRGQIQSVYIPHVLIKMRTGGESNRSLSKVWLKSREDYAALRSNNVGGIWTLLQKNFGKLRQFI